MAIYHISIPENGTTIPPPPPYSLEIEQDSYYKKLRVTLIIGCGLIVGGVIFVIINLNLGNTQWEKQ